MMATQKFIEPSAAFVEMQYLQYLMMASPCLLGVRVAEEGRQYAVAVPNDVLQAELKRIALQTSLDTAAAQLARLYRLANLLSQPEPIDRSADVVAAYATELRNTTNSLEEVLNAVIASTLQGFGPDEPEV